MNASSIIEHRHRSWRLSVERIVHVVEVQHNPVVAAIAASQTAARHTMGSEAEKIGIGALDVGSAVRIARNPVLARIETRPEVR